MLQLSNVSKNFSGLRALSGATFDVKEGQIKGLIGPNGAGKTTAFNLITGVFPPSRGTITFVDKEITQQKPEDITRLGISRTFQQPHLFKSLTVLENVMLGRHYRTRAEFLACGFRLRQARREEKQIYEQSLEYLNMLGLAEKRRDSPTNFPR
jgi:branched-chain amino acid transport system ATP-binding protein